MIPEYSDLTCDGPNGCGNHIKIRTPVTREEMLSHVDTPCPKCGENMLTEASAEAGWRLLQGAREAYVALCDLGLVRKPGEAGEASDIVTRVQVGSTPDGGIKLHRAVVEPVNKDRSQ